MIDRKIWRTYDTAIVVGGLLIGGPLSWLLGSSLGWIGGVTGWLIAIVWAWWICHLSYS